MKKLNPHILLVIQWLQNPESVSRNELRSNLANANAAYDAAFGSASSASTWIL